MIPAGASAGRPPWRSERGHAPWRPGSVECVSDSMGSRTAGDVRRCGGGGNRTRSPLQEKTARARLSHRIRCPGEPPGIPCSPLESIAVLETRDGADPRPDPLDLIHPLSTDPRRRRTRGTLLRRVLEPLEGARWPARVFEIDPPSCADRGSEMNVVSVISPRPAISHAAGRRPPSDSAYKNRGVANGHRRSRSLGVESMTIRRASFALLFSALVAAPSLAATVTRVVGFTLATGGDDGAGVGGAQRPAASGLAGCGYPQDLSGGCP